MENELVGRALPKEWEGIADGREADSQAADEVKDNKGIWKVIKVALVISVIAGLIATAYTAVANYYADKFYFNTVINGINFSGQTVEEAEAVLAAEVRSYYIELSGRGDLAQTLYADDLMYQYISDGSVQKIKEHQNSYSWIRGYLNWNYHTVDLNAAMDDKTFNETFQNLVFFNEENVIVPQNAYVEYIDGRYEIIPEVTGNQVQDYVLYDYLQEAIANGEAAFSLEDIDCYAKPEITAESQELIDMAAQLNHYAQTQITYDFGEETVILDTERIHEWLSFNEEDYTVTFHEENVGEYVAQLAAQYDTYNLPRNLVTHDGSVVEVRATAYGWEINQEAETAQLTEDIKNGVQQTRDPIYNHTAVSRMNSDMGGTYVEIDMTQQKLLFYKDGELLVETDVVTGNLAAGHRTPPGTFTLKYKQRDTVLRGEDYESPVRYWMPFNGGIGLHDANWRWNFGGEIYRYSGSHGCINMPTEQARVVFENIEAGIPIICYYRE